MITNQISAEAQGAGNAVNDKVAEMGHLLENPEYVRSMLVVVMGELLDTQRKLIEAQAKLTVSKRMIAKLRRDYKALDEKYLVEKLSNMDI